MMDRGKALIEETKARQRAAAAPDTSAWVSANAGTGKTHVLVDRVARLLLAGAEPSRILCITYTKAAAAEMETRLFKRLGEWSLQVDKILRQGLRELQGTRPEPDDLKRARRLFARALETPGGLKIQTIHAFCQSVLKRFPLEAGIDPGFRLLENETATRLQTMARRRLFERVSNGKDDELCAAHTMLVTERDEAQLALLLDTLMKHGDEFEDLFARHPGAALWDELWRHLGLSPGASVQSIIEAETTDAALDRNSLEAALPHLRAGAPTSKKAADAIDAFLSGDRRSALFDQYCRVFLKKDGDALVRLTTKGAEAAEDTMRAEQMRLVGVKQRIKAANTAKRTRALLSYGRAYLNIYAEQKAKQGALDFNDLIIRMRNLLNPPGDAWVHYKLDEGIDHILIDEAQDTSPQQWQIVKRLAREMTTGLGAAEDSGRARSMFAVGDVKQSIYRFQGAEPRNFSAMRKHFAQRSKEAGLGFAPVGLELSWRSSEPVLALVDEIINKIPLSSADDADGADGADGAPGELHHKTRYVDAPGLVELWPLFTPEDEPDDKPWDVPLDSSTSQSPEGRLAARIADTIGTWLTTGEILAGADRPIRPSDIIILVRQRSAFMEHMIRALKVRGIPVAGADRLHITEHIAVMDLMALGAFALCPSDDLTLAEVLKSPFVGFDDELLFELAHGRKGGLWAELERRANDNARFGDAYSWLKEVFGRADFLPPYEFFATALVKDGGKAKLLARLGPDAEDPIEEFMLQALLHERNQVPSLQGFLHALGRDKAEIKRDMDKGREEVRVMTVHAAKGLESNIVFLPDTCTLPKAQSDNGILKSHAVGREGEPEDDAFFIWAPRKAEDDPIAQLAREAYTRETEFEYRRLFYVAMTRARERLYICGWTGKRPRQEGSWHALAEQALEGLGTQVEGLDGTSLLRFAKDGPPREDTATPERDAAKAGAIPMWARTTAPSERLPRRLSPSRLGEEPSVFAPGGEPGKAAKRGRLVHRLLEVLPDIPADARADAALHYLAAHAEDFDTAECEELIREILTLMAVPELAALFGAHSRAEVALSGMVEINGRLERIEGRVDRLAVTEDAVWVLDYKTNRPAAKTLDDVPEVYWRQMAGYRALLKQIYPRINVRCALVWTHKPEVMELPEDKLESQWIEIAGKTGSAN